MNRIKSLSSVFKNIEYLKSKLINIESQLPVCTEINSVIEQRDLILDTLQRLLELSSSATNMEHIVYSNFNTEKRRQTAFSELRLLKNQIQRIITKILVDTGKVISITAKKNFTNLYTQVKTYTLSKLKTHIQGFNERWLILPSDNKIEYCHVLILKGLVDINDFSYNRFFLITNTQKESFEVSFSTYIKYDRLPRDRYIVRPDNIENILNSLFIKENMLLKNLEG